MKLELEQYVSYKAQEEIKCDATELFFGNEDRKELCFTHNEVVIIFKSRFGKIRNNDDAIFVQVKDENGELLNFNCRSDMHTLMMKYLLYPSIIQKIFK